MNDLTTMLRQLHDQYGEELPPDSAWPRPGELP